MSVENRLHPTPKDDFQAALVPREMEVIKNHISIEILQGKINNVRKACGYIQKDAQIGSGGWSYKAVTRDAVIAHLRKEIVKNEILIYPHLVSSKSEWIELKSKKVLWYQGIFCVHFCFGKEKISFNVEAHALDSGDKGPSKATTMAEKTAIIKLFLIETGENEESREAENEESRDAENKASSPTREGGKGAPSDLEGDALNAIAVMRSSDTLEIAKNVFGLCYKDLKRQGASEKLKSHLQQEWNKVKHKFSVGVQNG